MIIMTLQSLLLLMNLASEGQGWVDFIFEPKHCVTDPCPQFRMVAVDQKPVKEVGANVRFFQGQRPSSLKAFDKIRIEGKWKESDEFPGHFDFFQTSKIVKKVK